MYDLIVIGAGFVGSIVARSAAETGKHVLIVERRNHIAGNMFDEIDTSGIRVQRYGPHIFHTNSEEAYQYVLQHGEWIPFSLECMVNMNGKTTPSPFNFQTIDDYYSPEKADLLKERLAQSYPGRAWASIVELLNCQDTVVREYAQFLYDSDYAPYTAKQWGIKASEIDLSVLQRVPVRITYYTGYFDDTYQLMPKRGYHTFFGELLNYHNIDIQLNTDALPLIQLDDTKNRALWKGNDIPIVYTGPLDELFGCCYGVLPYRSLRFEYHTENCDSYQPAPVVAYPQAEGYTRITEYKKLPLQQICGKTTVALEYPVAYVAGNAAEPYYPIITQRNLEQHQKYMAAADAFPNLFYGGRLADYKYYNMDQAVLRGLELWKTVQDSLSP